MTDRGPTEHPPSPDADILSLQPPDGDEPPPEAFEEDDDYGDEGRGWVLRTIAVVAILGLIALFVIRPAGETELGEFDLPTLDGSGSVSSASLKGRPVVINFWASWCGPCREEAPHLERVWQRFRDRGVVVLGVNVQDRPEWARAFVAEEGLTFPIVTDYDRVLAGRLQIYGLPQTFFVDPSWRFHGEFAGTSEGRQTPLGFAGAGSGVAVLGAISEEDLTRHVIDMLGEDE